MKVSVLVAAYNYGRFLPAALDSALAQDFGGELECVVVDDGSTDETPSVLEAYRGRVVAIRRDNEGQAAALNAAYAAASGDVLCLLDADDLWDRGKVGEVAAAFERFPEVGLVHHPLRVVGPDGRALEPPRRKEAAADGDVSELMRRTTLRWIFAPTSGLCLRRSVARRVFPLRTGLRSSADELVAPVAALLAPVRSLAPVLGSYRLHGANTWASWGPRAGETPELRRRRAEWTRRLLEEKVAQANDALRRSGATERLSPWMKWDYVKAVADVERRSALAYLPRVLAEAARANALSLPMRLRLVAGVVRKSIRHGRRRGGSSRQGSNPQELP